MSGVPESQRARLPDLGTITPAEYENFRRHVLALTQIDLNNYKREQLMRRLATLRSRVQCRTLGEYARRLSSDPAELSRFRDWFSINVTEFFRDPECWQVVHRRVLPALLAQKRQLRIWSAGCSDGSESYSLLMLLAEFRTSGPHHVLATDLDAGAIEIAVAGGPYTDNHLRNVSELQRRLYFTAGDTPKGGWWMRPELRRAITFRRSDILNETPDQDFDLIVCRNVIIYFTGDAKDAVLRRFGRALRPGGFLFLGGTELMPRARDSGFMYEAPSIYRYAVGDARPT